MDLKTKIGLIILTIITLGLLGFIVYHQYEIEKRQDAIQTQMTQMKTLPDGTQRAETHWATKEDLEALGKQNSVDMQAVQKDLETLHASLTAVNVVSVKSSEQVANNLSATSTTPNPNPQGIPTTDAFGYFKNRQVLKLDENFDGTKVPIGEVGFSAWQAKPFDLNLQSRTYSVATVIGTDENQKQYAYNKFVIKVGDKEYPVKIANNTFSQEYPEAKFHFEPRLFLGVNGGLNINQMKGEAFPDLSLGVIQYSKFTKNPTLTFLDVGIGYAMIDKRPIVSITPITYNIGEKLPLIDNVHLGPVLGVETNGNLTVGAGFRIGM